MRRLKASDAKAMAAIHTESFDRSWGALEMAAHTQKDICLGQEKDGALAAFIIISHTADQAEILTLATAKAARRTGLAKQILEASVAELKSAQAKELFLEVAEDNISAIALYRGSGFDPIGRRPGYYRRKDGRVAALTFSKKL